MQIRQPLATSPIDDRVVAKVKDWEKHCLNIHAECHALMPKHKQYPTRLLDVHNVIHNDISLVIDVPSDFRD